MVFAQFIIVFKRSEDPMNLMEIKIYDNDDINIAKNTNTKVYLSDCYDDTLYYASNINDDNTSTFVHTTRGAIKNHYIIINLGSTQNISKVVIHNRHTGNFRIYNATVALLSETFINVLDNFGVNLSENQNQLRTSTEYITSTEISNHNIYTTTYDENNEISLIYTIETLQQIQSVILAPENIITDLSSNLEVILRVPTGDIAPTLSIDPSYIANLDGAMTSSDGGLTWNGSINRTPGMNLLGNTLTVTSGDLSSNIAFDVLENGAYKINEPFAFLGDISGDYLYDYFGGSVSLSSDGNRVAIGAKNYDENGSNSGQVRIYELNDSWQQLGEDILGANASDYFGTSVSLSGDGNRVAIGAPQNDTSGNNCGQTQIYEWNSTAWQQIGSDINGETTNALSGKSVSISSDGNVVAIGAEGYFAEKGSVRIFEWNSNNWQQIGSSIVGENIYDKNGASVSLSSDGNRVAMGAPQNDNNNSNSGKVRIYERNSNIWQPVGDAILGTAVNERFGISVSLSENRVAIGAQDVSGFVQVYEFNSGTWKQVGNTLLGEAASDYFGNSVSLSGDGNRIAIGAPYDDISGSNTGKMQIYEWNSGTWQQIGNNISGKTVNDYLGFTVSLSRDGNRVVVGATNANDNGTSYIYSLPKTYISRQLTSITLDPSNIEYPNTSSNFQINFTTNDKTFDDISGNVSLTSSVSNIDTSSLALTNYGFRLEGNIVADPYSESVANKITYFETVDISGESANFTINTNPDFELLGCTLTPENLVDTDVSATLRIEFNTPLPDDTNLNNYIELDPSYIATLGPMSNVSSGFVWEGTLTRTPNMNKLGNKLDFDFSYNGVEVSANLVYDVVVNKNVLKWVKKTDTSLNETFNETVEISPNGQILAQISGYDAKIYHLQSDSTWSLESEISGNHLALCDNRIAIATSSGVDVYEYDSNWTPIGSPISETNVSNLDISNHGNRVAYIYDVSSIGIQEYTEGSWLPMTMAVSITGNSVKFSPNGLLLGVGTLDSGNQNFSNVVLYEYFEGSGWNLKT